MPSPKWRVENPRTCCLGEPRSNRSPRDGCAESCSSFARTLSCSGCRGGSDQHRRRTRAQTIQILLGVEVHVAVDVLGCRCTGRRFSVQRRFLLARGEGITHGSPSGHSRHSSVPSSGTLARSRCGSGRGTLREEGREASISRSPAGNLPSSTHEVCPTAASGRRNSRLHGEALVSTRTTLLHKSSLARLIKSNQLNRRKEG